MNLLDAAILVFLLAALVRGYGIGLVQQAFSTLGFLSGMLGGAWLQRHLMSHISSASSKALVSFAIIFGAAAMFLTLGEYIGSYIKLRIASSPGNAMRRADNLFGSLLSGATLLIIIWLAAPIFVKAPLPNLQKQINNSRIIHFLNRDLPPTPNLMASLGHLIDPNGFPNVFINNEPNPSSVPTPQSFGNLQTAVNNSRASVVKVSSRGCGGIVDGSGFVASADYVITNAHVVAGVTHPYVVDGQGQHAATTVFFDPQLDVAILHAGGLPDPPLTISSHAASVNQPAAVLGYPGGGAFNPSAATIIDHFIAIGKDIYNQNTTNRDVYSLKTTIVPGNSGGPLIDGNGQVIGLVFAKSTTYDQVGYALSMPAVTADFNQAKTSTAPVTTGDCAE